MNTLLHQLFPDLATPLAFSEELLKVSKSARFEQETVILNSDDYVKVIPLVMQSNIKVIREDESGKEILLYYVKAGESCIMSILAANSNLTSKVKAVAEPNTEMLLLPTQQLPQLTKNYASWGNFVMKQYHKRFEELLNVINELAFTKIDERLKELLLKKVEIAKDKEIQTTHQQLADELGTAREVVSRLLKVLESKGKIKISRGKLKIISLE